MGNLYTVLASLPHLRHFSQVKRLPINEARLRERIEMAPDPERATLLDVYDLLAWHRGSEQVDDQELLARFRSMLERSHNPTVHGVLRVRLRVRLLLTSLRYQILGTKTFPASLGAFDLEPLLYTVRARWNQPAFGLSARFPELVRGEELLRARRSADLERLLFDVVWSDLELRAQRSRIKRPFGLDELIVYVFKWDLARRWLLYGGAAAVARFERIVEELTRPEQWRRA